MSIPKKSKKILARRMAASLKSAGEYVSERVTSSIAPKPKSYTKTIEIRKDIPLGPTPSVPRK